MYVSKTQHTQKHCEWEYECERIQDKPKKREMENWKQRKRIARTKHMEKRNESKTSYTSICDFRIPFAFICFHFVFCLLVCVRAHQCKRVRTHCHIVQPLQFVTAAWSFKSIELTTRYSFFSSLFRSLYSIALTLFATTFRSVIS